MSINENLQNECLAPSLAWDGRGRMDFQIRVVELSRQESQLYRGDFADYVFELSDEPYHRWAECLYVTLRDLEYGLFPDLLMAIRRANALFQVLAYDQLDHNSDAQCAEEGQYVLWDYWLRSGFGTN